MAAVTREKSRPLGYVQEPKTFSPELGETVYEIILHELEGFFRRQQRNPVAALSLDVRFQRMYSDEEEIDWTLRFRTDVDFFELLTTTPASEIADLLTEDDLSELCLIPPKRSSLTAKAVVFST